VKDEKSAGVVGEEGDRGDDVVGCWKETDEGWNLNVKEAKRWASKGR